MIAEAAGVTASARNVRRVLHNTPHLKLKKLRKCPRLTSAHKEERLDFARQHIRWSGAWYAVLFSDEKKFTLDGPDAYSSYFHDLRKEERCLQKRQTGGGSVMVWGAVGHDKKTDIVFIAGNITAASYLELIREHIQKFREQITSEGDAPPFIFQQDNAAVHTARCVKEYFKRENIACMNWPARSPDIFEYVWSHLARAFYRDSWQFSTVEELKNVIRPEWTAIPQNYIRKLFRSLPNRMLAVVEGRGNSTGYWKKCTPIHSFPLQSEYKMCYDFAAPKIHVFSIKKACLPLEA
jgi:hypothetical protein